MHLWVCAVGHMKEPFYRQAQDEYSKRLQKYASLTVAEVAAEPVPQGQQDRLAVKQREGQRLQKRVHPGSLMVALDMRGQAFSSEQLASWLGSEIDSGCGAISFLIGGTLGLSHEVLEQSRLISLSRLTFPHQMARVILLEQLYRAYRILSHAPYHY